MLLFGASGATRDTARGDISELDQMGPGTGEEK